MLLYPYFTNFTPNENISIVKQCFYLFAIATITLASCTDEVMEKELPPIVMGDSATIVTETDSQYLRNEVADLVLETPEKKAPAPKDTTPTVIKEDVLTLTESGIVIRFEGCRRFQEQGGKYLIAASSFPSAISFSPALKTVSITQSYKSYLQAKGTKGTLSLAQLGHYSAQPQKLNAAGKTQPLSTAIFMSMGAKQLQDGLKKALAASGKPRKDRDVWLRELRNVKSEKDKALETVVSEVSFVINGKSPAGKTISKTVVFEIK